MRPPLAQAKNDLADAIGHHQKMDARIVELIEANNREVNRRRLAEGQAVRLKMIVDRFIQGPAETAPDERYDLAVDAAWEAYDGSRAGDGIGRMRDAVTAAMALLMDHSDPSRPTHRHRKRGSAYREMFRDGRVQTSRPVIEGDTLVTYVAEDGSIWHRLPEEFDDGRFEAIEPGSAER